MTAAMVIVQPHPMASDKGRTKADAAAEKMYRKPVEALA
jgi:hypothetical protein